MEKVLVGKGSSMEKRNGLKRKWKIEMYGEDSELKKIRRQNVTNRKGNEWKRKWIVMGRIFLYIKDDDRFSCTAVALVSSVNARWCFRDQTKLTI